MTPVVSTVREDAHWKVECSVGGKVVSWIIINDLRWRIGSAVVRIGGIGGVGTLKDHRNKGYSRLCMDESLAFMQRTRMPMSALFGIPNFYTKWGFAPVIPEPLLRIATSEASHAEPVPGLRVARFNPKRHHAASVAMMRVASRLRSGSVIPSAWRSRVRRGSDWTIRADNFAVVNRAGALAGYAAHDVSKTEMKVSELGFRTPSVFPVLTRELARRARLKHAESIQLQLPPDHPYALYLRRWNLHATVSYYANGQGMGRIVCMEETLRACAPELARRLAASRFHRSNLSLGLATDIGAFTLVIRQGKLSVRSGLSSGPRIRVGQGLLTQWLLGYRPVDPKSAPTRLLPLLIALFPSGYPYLYQVDRF
jgi:hypothetical protein